MNADTGTKKVYKYVAKNSRGQNQTGKIKADSVNAVAEYLIRQGYSPITINEDSSLNKEIGLSKKKVKLKDLALFFRQFATLIKAGIPLMRGLDLLIDQTANPTLKQHASEVKKEIMNGEKLGDALGMYPEIFPPVVIGMISAGEKAGYLESTLEDVAENLEADLKLKQKIKSAMTYPIAILSLAALLVTAMLLFIVPIFDEMFESLGSELPLPTQILVMLADLIKVGGIPIAAGIIALVVLYNKNKHKEGFREVADPIRLKIPIFGNLTHKIAISRLTRNFASLLAAGLGMMEALNIVGETAGNYVIQRAIEEVKVITANGERLSVALRSNEVFPMMLVEMVSVGEDAGDIPSMMYNTALAYDQEVNTTTEQLSSLMEPLMLVVLGSVVGGVVIALYMPIFSIFDAIQG